MVAQVCLKGGGKQIEGFLEEPAVGLELTDDFGVPVPAHAAGELAVPYPIRVFISDHEIGNPGNDVPRAGERGAKHSLVDDGRAAPHGFPCALRAVGEAALSQVPRHGKCGEMLLFVALPQLAQDELDGGRLPRGLSMRQQIHPARARARAVECGEAGCSQGEASRGVPVAHRLHNITEREGSLTEGSLDSRLNA